LATSQQWRDVYDGRALSSRVNRHFLSALIWINDGNFG